MAAWPLLLLAAPAFVAIWSGWVDLGRLTGFGVVHLLPGIADRVRLNTAITLPIGLEAYGAYASYVWLTARVPGPARRFAKRSAIGSLALGAAGQVAYHLMVAAGWQRAPWPITMAVSCVPVAVFGLGLALRHLINVDEDVPAPPVTRVDAAPVAAAVPAIPVSREPVNDDPTVSELAGDDAEADTPALEESAGQVGFQDSRSKPEIEALVRAIKAAQPEWGYQRIADAALTSKSNVGRILRTPRRNPEPDGEPVNGRVPELVEVAS